MTYAEITNRWLIGKTIKRADTSGHAIVLEFEDGSRLDYDASDGGYSSWRMEPDTRTKEGGAECARL